jgi:hypothetical protein
VSRPSFPPGTRSAKAKQLRPIDIARADVAAGRFSTLRAERDSIDKSLSGPRAYWYVGHYVDVALVSGGPKVAHKFEFVAGPFGARSAADKVIERVRARADKES